MNNTPKSQDHRHPFAVRLSATLEREREILEKRHLSPWLLAFSAGSRLEIDDLRGGKIVFDGIRFGGSTELVFDQFVSRLLRDQAELTLEISETELQTAETRQHVQKIASIADGAVSSHLNQIWQRATEIKRKLLKRDHAYVRIGPRASTSVTNEIRAQKAYRLEALANQNNALRLALFENRGPIYLLLTLLATLLSIASFALHFISF